MIKIDRYVGKYIEQNNHFHVFTNLLVDKQSKQLNKAFKKAADRLTCHLIKSIGKDSRQLLSSLSLSFSLISLQPVT